MFLTLLCGITMMAQTDSVDFTPMGSGYTPSSITTSLAYDAAA